MGKRRRAGSVLAVPSWAVLAGLGLVVVALLGYFITGTPDRAEQAAATQPATTPSAAPSPTPTPAPARTTEPEEVPRAYVEVFNNTRTSGLASSASDKIQGAGWKVVGTDNWSGNIPETTVYYPKRLKAQADLLAADLKVDRVKPAVDPMKFDRLTVILTSRL
ncbi:LytR C-terminal domain-containing protein [Solicola sp. PLA-1-18]|uniref:LytR C-terminal domain-containing protein n=1 Tax=Solicola sp. PLA-1-18 TaxID=3380532 RepID=UPI003B808120